MRYENLSPDGYWDPLKLWDDSDGEPVQLNGSTRSGQVGESVKVIGNRVGKEDLHLVECIIVTGTEYLRQLSQEDRGWDGQV